MILTPPVYNAKEKVWNGPAIDQRIFDVPFGELLLNELAIHGDKLIQINHDTGERMTCKEMRLKSLKVAENLGKIGIKRGDHVSIVVHHRGDVAPFLVGAVAYGAVLNFIFVGSTAYELSYLFEIVKPKLIVSDGEVIGNITRSLENVNIDPMIYAFSKPNDQIRSMEEFFMNYDTEPSAFQLPKIADLKNTPVFIMPTSGSSGLPKCVLMSHAMVSSASPFAANDGINRYYALVPVTILTVLEIAASILFRSPRIFTAQPITTDLILDVLQKHDVNVCFMFPHTIAELTKRLLTESYDLTKLTTVISGSSSLSETTRNNLNKALPNIELGFKYGMTEVGLISCANARTKKGSVGYLVAGMSARIINEDGIALGPGEFGEIYLRQSFPILGYLDNEAATKAIFNADGWVLTGDIGYFDIDGELFVIDRKKNLIKCMAIQVPPIVLEEYVKKHFHVQDIVVVGVPGEGDVGHLPAALVVLPPNSTVTEADINMEIEANFTVYKLYGGVYFVESIPRTGNGKVQRYQAEQIATELYELRRGNL